MTKLLVTMIDWEYPSDGKPPMPYVWDLQHNKDVMGLYLSLANGIIVEMKADGDSEEAVAVLRGLLMGAGGCETVILSDSALEKLWLYEEDYECYKQGDKSPAYIFVNPFPQPHKFARKE